jgi:PAS domain S-box-containing protein
MATIRPEKALQEPLDLPLTESLYEDAFESAPHGLAVLSANGNITRANRALCQMLGFARNELESLNCGHITHPDDLRTELEQRRRLASADIGRYELVLRYVRKDGGSVWVRLAVSATRRKTAPTTLIAAAEPVPCPVKASRKGEDQLLQQLGDAALSAAHEIGNTLTPLMMNAEMLLEHATKKEVRDAAHQVFMAARRIAFVLRRMRGVEGAPKVAYVGSERMLDLARIAPLDRASGQG